MSKLGGKWSQFEDDLLLGLVQQLGENWENVAAAMKRKQITSTRTAETCKNRWNHLNSSINKSPFSDAEDQFILYAVLEEKIMKWSQIAVRLQNNRIGKQVRERWFNHLDPALKKTRWSAEEDKQLIHLQQIFGNSWVKISQHIAGRSENEVKNRWYSAPIRRLLQSQQPSLPNHSEDVNMLPVQEKNTTIKLSAEEKKYFELASSYLSRICGVEPQQLTIDTSKMGNMGVSVVQKRARVTSPSVPSVFSDDSSILRSVDWPLPKMQVVSDRTTSNSTSVSENDFEASLLLKDCKDYSPISIASLPSWDSRRFPIIIGPLQENDKQSFTQRTESWSNSFDINTDDIELLNGLNSSTLFGSPM